MSTSAQQKSFKTDKRRLFKDRFAQYSITAGGVMVLVALLLIFFYLLYVVEPILESAKVEKRTDVSLSSEKNYVGIGVEEQTEIAYLLEDSGHVDFYHIKGDSSGQLMKSLDVELDGNITTFAKVRRF